MMTDRPLPARFVAMVQTWRSSLKPTIHFGSKSDAPSSTCPGRHGFAHSSISPEKLDVPPSPTCRPARNQRSGRVARPRKILNGRSPHHASRAAMPAANSVPPITACNAKPIDAVSTMNAAPCAAQPMTRRPGADCHMPAVRWFVIEPCSPAAATSPQSISPPRIAGPLEESWRA